MWFKKAYTKYVDMKCNMQQDAHNDTQDTNFLMRSPCRLHNCVTLNASLHTYCIQIFKLLQNVDFRIILKSVYFVTEQSMRIYLLLGNWVSNQLAGNLAQSLFVIIV